ncbi:uncharacterized protein LOC106086630 [Stomoxys calcitrans]|uniref:uncharacterized protein LOC106086630 n=1 Tax=Stomoxys calcitrans TaxID=35570 RepID=UPI0027E21FF6|nr:uncharacterized protein LOC106086630 [Stomoxys calcitrans]
MVPITCVFRIFLMAGLCSVCKGGIDVTTYNKMPPLYETDDYDQCLLQTNASFCVAYVEIEANYNSKLWQQIWQFQNSYQFRYRHDQLYRGVCTAKCETTSSNSYNISIKSKEALRYRSTNMRMASKLHKISQSQNAIVAYESQIHDCVHREFLQGYNLSVRTFVTYCVNLQEPLEKGPWYKIACLIFIVIGALNVISTSYDLIHRSKQKNKESNSSYDDGHKHFVEKYFCSFSMYRNYCRLIISNSNDAIGKDLQFLDGVRAILSITVVVEHIAYAQYMPIKNPEFVENLYMSAFFLSLMHVVVCIEVFFMLSGLMLYLKFNKGEYVAATSSLKECAVVYIRLLISRYLRYLPSLLLLLLFTSHMLLNLQNAPFWRHVMEPNVILCRSEWWANVLMTSNLGLNNCCWVHTWYIAADFQLYAIFLTVLIIVSKYPHLKMRLYIGIGTLGWALPSAVSYFKELQSVSTMNLENYRHMYLKNVETGKHLYLSPYANLNGFLLGIVCGELYMKYLRQQRYKRIVAAYLRYSPLYGWLLIFLIWYLGSVLFFKDRTIWTALFPILHKHLSVTIVAIIVVIYNMCHGGAFLNWPIFRFLARISYQVYLWHFPVLFSIFANFHQPLEVTHLFMVILFVSTYLSAAVIAILMTIMVEYPIANLLSAFELKVTKYRQMPSLYELDDYDECLQQQNASYCMVYIEIQPNNKSTLWQHIWNFQTSYKFRYRHDILYRGVCTTKCSKYPNGPSIEKLNREIIADSQPVSENIVMIDKLHHLSRSQNLISLYEDQLHECLSNDFLEKYHLNVKTFLTYCESFQEPLSKGLWYNISVFLLIAIVIANLLSTWYDFRLKLQKTSKESTGSNYYSIPHSNPVHRYMCAFSLYRNYRRIMMPKSNAMDKDLRFVDGIRTLLSCVIVLEHINGLAWLYLTTYQLIMQHIVVIIEIFFLLTTMLLYLTFQKDQHITPTTSLKECATTFFRMIVSRYLRYIPSILLLVVFTSHILLQLNNGPLWRHVMEPQVIFCRSFWWSHLLMKDTFAGNDNCMAHTWYISADFQIYVLFSAVLIVITKYPKWKIPVYSVIGMLGMTLPSIVSYFNNLESHSTSSLESFRHWYAKDMETGLHLYGSIYANLNAAFMGFVCAELFTRCQANDEYRKMVVSFLRPIRSYCCLAILCIWLLGSKLFFMEHSIWTALFPILHKNFFVITFCAIVMLYNFCNGGGFLTWPIFRFLARISFQLYLWLIPFIFALYASNHHLWEASYPLMLTHYNVIYVLSVVVAFLVTVMFEYPVAELFSAFNLKNRKSHLKSF